MSNRFSSDISKLDTSLLDTVHSLTIEPSNSQNPGSTVLIEALYGDQHISIRFINVSKFAMPDITHGVLQFGECFIDDIADRQIENVKYELTDELSKWHCLFEAISFSITSK